MQPRTAIAALLELPAATLLELAVAMRSGSLRYGISEGLLLPYAGDRSSGLATALKDTIAEGCSIKALAGVCEGVADAKAQVEEAQDNIFLALSGPDVPGVPVVDTATMVRSLFQEARNEVLITSYVFHNASDLLAPLVDRCNGDTSFRVRVIVDLSHSRKSAEEPLPIVASRFRREFLDNFWQGAQEPELWHDPRVFETADRAKAGVMHAKVVVIDDTAALITSANFTAAAQNRNIEAGVLTRNPHQAVRLKNYFEGLIRLGLLRAVR